MSTINPLSSTSVLQYNTAYLTQKTNALLNESSKKSDSTTPVTSDPSDISALIDATVANMEHSNMALLASMTPVTSGVDTLGYLYAQNGIMSSLAPDPSTVLLKVE